MRTSLTTVAFALVLLLISALLAATAPAADAHGWSNDGYFGHGCAGGQWTKETCWVESSTDKYGRHLHKYSHARWGFHSHFVWCADSGWVCGAAF